MSEQHIVWEKTSKPKSYEFQLSQKLTGKLDRRGLWSPEGNAEIGKRQFRFRSNGKANMELKVYEGPDDQLLGTLTFHWKDFQKSTLVLADGKKFHFKGVDILRGAWGWLREDSSNEVFTFRVDTPLHRSGLIENGGGELSAQERDLLLLLGLNMQHYLNIWLMTLTFVVVVAVAG